MKFLIVLLAVFTLSLSQNLAFAGGDSDGDCTSRHDGARGAKNEKVSDSEKELQETDKDGTPSQSVTDADSQSKSV